MKYLRAVAEGTALSCLFGLGIGACSGEQPLPSGSELTGEERNNFDEHEIRELQSYLSRYGYLPNDQLMNNYPAWRPVTNERVIEGQFDRPTEVALRALQYNFGLPPSGVLDEATLRVIRSPRCGFPDNFEPTLDPSNKFAIVGKLSDRTLVWRLSNTDDQIPLDDARIEASAAFDKWDKMGDLSFERGDDALNADIKLDFVSGDPPAGHEDAIATAMPPAGGSDIKIYKKYDFVIGGQDDKYDLRSILTHEIGHAIGLGHSSIGSATQGALPISQLPTMYPTVTSGNTAMATLEDDDKMAARSLYGWSLRLEEVSDVANDVALGPLAEAWKVGTTQVPGGYKVFTREDTRWKEDVGAGAKRISLSGDRKVWAVNSSGQIFRRKDLNLSTLNAWQLMPETGTDIGASNTTTNPAVWKIGTTPAGSNFDISMYDPATNAWVPDKSGGSAVRIAVDKENVPWVVSANGMVFRRKSSDPNQDAGWQQHPNLSNQAYDIGVYDPRYPFIVSRTGNTTDGYEIRFRNIQKGIGDFAEARDGWVPYNSVKGTSVAAGGNSMDAFVANYYTGQTRYLYW